MAKSYKTRDNEYYRANAHRIVGHLQDLSPAVYRTVSKDAKGKSKDHEVAMVAVLLSAYPEMLAYICGLIDMSRGERAANGKGRPLIADSRMFGHLLFPDGFPKVKKTKTKAQPQPQTKTTTEKVPRGFVLLDNGGQSRDRYTILETVSRPLSSRGGGNFHPYLRFSVNPYSSYGKMSYGELNETAFQNIKSGGYAYFGKRINLSDLVDSGAHMTALAYIQDSAAERAAVRAVLKRKPNHHRTGILSEDYPADPYRRDLATAYDPYDAYWRSPNPPRRKPLGFARGKLVGIFSLDELTRLKASADAPLLCYVFRVGEGYEVREFKTRADAHNFASRAESVGPTNQYPSFWKMMVPLTSFEFRTLRGLHR